MLGHPANAEHAVIRGIRPAKDYRLDSAARVMGLIDSPSLAGHVDDYAGELDQWLASEGDAVNVQAEAEQDEAAGQPDVAHGFNVDSFRWFDDPQGGRDA